MQGNLLLDEKRQRDLFDSNVARYRRLSAGITPRPDVIVWPETVVEWGIPLETPTLHLVRKPDGKPRLLLFSGLYPIRRCR